MARVRWSRTARGEFRALVLWTTDQRSPDLAARAAAEISDAVNRAARYPARYPWAGSVYATLAVLPLDVRRVLTRSRRHTVFYRYSRETNEAQILAVRGAGQLPPAADELSA